MSALFLFLAANAITLEPGHVDLVNIHEMPYLYEGTILETCGTANRGQPILFMKDWYFGRSRGGVRLDEALDRDGEVCIRAKVVRGQTEQEINQSGLVIVTVSHPPVLPDGWQLEVIKVLTP
jgi:hypothetical protein